MRTYLWQSWVSAHSLIYPLDWSICINNSYSFFSPAKLFHQHYFLSLSQYSPLALISSSRTGLILLAASTEKKLPNSFSFSSSYSSLTLFNVYVSRYWSPDRRTKAPIIFLKRLMIRSNMIIFLFSFIFNYGSKFYENYL